MSPSREPQLDAIVAEFTAALRRGQRPDLEAVLDQHPQWAAELRDLLTSVAMIEELKREVLPARPATEPADPVATMTLGDYRLIREVGRGGMGVVYEAVHQSLGRRVAIKVMHANLGNDPRYVERFRKEAQAAARLHHTNIVAVFGVGETEGRHYYVMEYVDGRPLNRVVRQLTRRSLRGSRPLAATPSPALTRGDVPRSPADSARLGSEPQPEAALDPPPSSWPDPRAGSSATSRYRWVAEIGAQIADALEYAHGQGLLHRDIKPGNLLLDARGGVWITDFGLVKHVANGETQAGEIVGTPQYMAPESFRSIYDSRSEVYCLGLTLYELATLHPPFAGNSTAELIQQITSRSPVAPRQIDPDLERDLETIIQKATALQPADRYPSAAALRDDLRAYREDRPIAARQLSLWEQWTRWRRRNPLAATWSSLSALLLTLLAASATVGYLWTADANRRLADQANSLRAEQAATDAARRQALANLERADANLALSMQAFDEVFRAMVSTDSLPRNEIEIDGFAELGGVETSVSSDDAELLRRLLRFYEQFTAQNAEKPALQAELARAYRRVANCYHLIGQFAAAVTAYRQAIPLYERQYAAAGSTLDDLLQLVRVKSELSTAYRSGGEIRAAGNESRSCLRLLDRDPRANEPAAQLEKARVLLAVGANDVLIASPLLSRPRGTGREESSPPSLGTPSLELPALSRRGNGERASSLGATGYDRRRLEDIQNAIAITESLLATAPDNAEYLFASAKGFSFLAALLVRNQPAEAERALQRAIELFEQLGRLFPEDLQYRYFMALAYSMNLSPELEVNTEQLERAHAIANELVARSPHVLDFKKLKIKVNIQHGRRALADGELDAAWRDLEGARSELATVERDSAGEAFWRVHRLLADSYRRLAEKYQARRETRKAADAMRAARTVAEQMRRPETSE